MAKKWSLARIARTLHRCKAWVHKWQQRYRARGLEGLYDLKRSGRPAFLDRDQKADFVRRIQLGPEQDDSISVFTARTIRDVLAAEFTCNYSMSGVYNLLKRLKFKRIRPRPRHEKRSSCYGALEKQDSTFGSSQSSTGASRQNLRNLVSG